MTTAQDTLTLVINSPSFGHGEMIPAKYTCEGENINPPLTIENIPPETKSLAVIIEDPDTANGTFDHWIIWNIRSQEIIKDNTVPGIVGKNGFLKSTYNGPCPPSGTHRYFFKVFAHDTMLSLRMDAGKQHLEKAMQKHILGQGELIGLYCKSKFK
jgi:Raf kinase inhibitor-like YbhB/YbcL family protein